MGKTEKGAIWIDKDKISAYDFYQGVYQTPDACVRMMFALFTDIDMAEVDKLISQDIVNAKKVLSFEITKFIRGEEDAIMAQNATNALFSGQGNLDNVPTLKIAEEELKQGIQVADLFVRANLLSSKGEVRRMCVQGGIIINDEKISDANKLVTLSDIKDGYIMLKKGKKNFVKVILDNE